MKKVYISPLNHLSHTPSPTPFLLSEVNGLEFRELLAESLRCVRPCRAISAFAVNVDMVTRVRREHGKLLPPLRNLPERRVISSAEELLSVLHYHLRKSLGAEWLIERRVGKELERIFEFREALGGNSAHVADTLSRFGFEVLLNIPKLSRKQASLLHEGILCFSPSGTLGHPSEFASEEEEIIHYIFEFEEDEIIELMNGESFRISQTGRFIASCDVSSPPEYLQEAFLKFSKEYARKARGAFLSGFHLLRSDEGFERFISLVNSWGSHLKIHLELGDFESENVLRRVLRELSPSVSSIGMNELELRRVCSVLSVPFEDSPESMVSSARKISEILETPVVVHHPLFSFSAGDGIDERDLALGVLTASTKASFSEVTPENARKMALSAELHPEGLRAVERIGERASAAFPSILIRSFSTSVGLGDQFSAGYMMSVLSR
ncbi:MAG: ADP-dependent phosphofructokinase/glucokinase [Archaeoglobi archaeon]|nr:ADP-dependent phosphofructokinase/glucokinase [Archaeoglobi archaeon]